MDKLSKIMSIFLIFFFYITHANYTSSHQYSPNYLTFVGFPLVSSIVPIEYIEYDIIDRKTLNLSFPYCKFRQTVFNWCCNYSEKICPPDPNTSVVDIYSYCIISEKWPQEDIIGWLNNTVYTDTKTLWLGYSYYCACKTPGRSVWINKDPDPHPGWNSCPGDIALWFFHVLLTIMYVCLMIYVIYILVLKIQIAKNLKLKSSEWLKFLTLLCIFWLLLSIMIRITHLIYQMTTRRQELNNQNVAGWLEIWAAITKIIGSIWSMFVFVGLAQKINSIGNSPSQTLFLNILKIVFVIVAMILELLLIAFFSGLAHELTEIGNAVVLSVIKHHADLLTTYLRCVLIDAVLIVFWYMIGFSTFIIFIYKTIGFWSDNEYKQEFLTRVYYLTGMVFICIFHLTYSFTILLVQAYGYQTLFTSDIYLSNTSGLWFTWFSSLFEWFWILFVSLALAVGSSKLSKTHYQSNDSPILSTGSV
jgi:hypothetical protein